MEVIIGGGKLKAFFIRKFHIGGSETIIIRTYYHFDKAVILLVEAKLVGACAHNVSFIHIDGGKF